MLDGCDPGLLEDGMAAGRLPQLRALREAGCATVISGLPGLGANALMPSLYTGTTPDRHGRYYHRQSEAGDYAAEAGHALAVRVPTFYDLLARDGRRVLLVNPPKAPVEPGTVSLRSISGWNAHLSVPENEFECHPASLQNEVWRKLGAPTRCPCLAHRHEHSASLVAGDVLASLEERIDQQVRLAAWQLAETAWDFAVVGLDAGHCAGHLLWHCHDPTHPDHPATVAPDPLAQICMKLDQGVGELVARLSGDVRVAIFAGPGMGPGHVHPDMLERVLQARRAHGGAGQRSARSTMKGLWRRMPAPWRRLLSGPGQWLDAKLQRSDYQGQDCFPVRLNDNVGGLRINLQGRERHGRVPEAAYERLGRELCSMLESLRCSRSGAPLVRRALLTAAQYGPAATATLPDVLVEWAEAGPIDSVSGEGITPFRLDTPPLWTGAHNDRMLLLLAGEGIFREDMPAEGSILALAGTMSALGGGPPALGDGYSLLAGTRTDQQPRQERDTGS